ncbi:hypothetical protein Esti_002277 [Eimeria stiedai]
MLAGRGTELAVGAVGINAERDASNADVSRLSDADIRLAHTDHATSHDFAGAPLFARGTSYETNSGFLSVTNSQDTATMSIANQLYMKGEHAMPDVLHDKAAASTKEAKADRAAALDDLENLLQLLDNNNLAT